MQALERKRLDILTPRDIFDHLDRFVIGQERAKRALAIAAYNHLRRVYRSAEERREGLLKKSNILAVGPTGSGKTHLARQLARVLEVPFAVVDATEFTEAGYYGRDVEQMVTELLVAANQDVATCQRGIIFIDEIDKIARRSHGVQTGAGARDIGGEGVQQALLKLLEGREIFVPLSPAPGLGRQDFTTVDTSDILFICAGTFSDLRRGPERPLGFAARREGGSERSNGRASHRDLVNYGMLEEFLGRLPVIIELDALTEDEMLAILTVPPDSIVREYRERLALDDVAVEFQPAALRPIVAYAQRRGMGARGLRSVVEEVMADVMFEAPERASESLVIDADFVLKKLERLDCVTQVTGVKR
jgi:ATP-dependent Clp protease ATP-binding subunit ClpX